jgi:hypothetical protein
MVRRLAEAGVPLARLTYQVAHPNVHPRRGNDP